VRREIYLSIDKSQLAEGNFWCSAAGLSIYSLSSQNRTEHTLKNDPHSEREARTYENPVASREQLLELINKQAAPISLEHIVEALGYDDEERIEGVRRRLMAMVRDGQIFRNRRGGFMSFDHMDLEKGEVMAHPDGFGFLRPESGGKDIFLPAREMRRLMHGDRAAVKITGVDERRDRREGSVVSVLERAHQSVVGRYHRESGIDFVVPEDKRMTQDIILSRDFDINAEPGDIVLVRIIEYPNGHNPPIGMIETVLGKENAPGMEVTIALNTHNIPHIWNEEVLEEVERIPLSVDEADKKGRVDFRDKPFVTIDGADAKDFDDAVYCEPLDKGFRLFVAIADVSHYVHKDTAIDREAVNRGTSVYFPGEVIPMLPEILSNGLCSLNPHVDRLTMVCEMEIGPSGAIKEYRFHEGLIHSHARLLYDQVYGFLFEGKPDATCEPLRESLEHLKGAYKALAKAREKRHAIVFDSKEVVFEYNEQRKIERIHPYERNEAHLLIEECMIAANVCAARFLKRHKIPTLFRVHEGPNPEKLPGLAEFLAAFGVRINLDKPTPRDYADALAQVKDRPEYHMIQTVMLRSMMQAQYSPDGKIGHFGLALKDYAHFTSPIRRYPDLLVHRGIRHWLRHQSREGFPYDLKAMTELGESCSFCERRADEATRDAADFLKCDFLQKHIGQEFRGVVTSVTSFGLFVQIEDLLIDGLVHVTSLKRDYWQYDPAHHRLVGERTGQVYRLGDRVQVKVMRVDMEQRKIDFDLIATEEAHYLEGHEGEGKPRENKKPAKRKPRGGKGRSRRKKAE